MPSTTRRRPLPALIFLVALLAVTALVWWRVIGRNTDSATSTTRPCPTPTVTTSASAVLPTPQSVTVVVLNSTTRAGIASQARDVLVSDGFAVPDPADNDTRRPIPGVAEIRYGPGRLSAAKLLRYYLPTAKLVKTTSADGSVVVSLGRKYKHLASRSAVQAALRRDGVVQQAAPTPTSSRSAAPSGSAASSGSPASSSC
jgi:cytoskeletal protein RodZ